VQRRVTAVTPEGGRLRVRLEDLAAECSAEHGSALGLTRGLLVGVRVPAAHARCWRWTHRRTSTRAVGSGGDA
jgi:hypothetical protein